MLNWEDENNMTDDVQNIAKLTLNGTTYDLPVMSPTAGPDVVDIRKLYAQANVFTYDPGFTSTAACDSTITFIDGEAGVLLHRGYPIDQLASQSLSRFNRYYRPAPARGRVHSFDRENANNCSHGL